MKYFALLTKLGENLIAQATALGTKIELTHMAVGDGGGTLPTPDTNQTKLIAEKRRAAINALFIDEKNKNQIIAEQIIPESEGGWWIREIGLFDKTGNLIAIANCPETYKPQLAEGSGRTQSIRMVLIVSHTESVTLKIDPSVVLATRKYVDDSLTALDNKIILELERYVKIGDYGIGAVGVSVLNNMVNVSAFWGASSTVNWLAPNHSYGAGWQSTYRNNRRAQAYVSAPAIGGNGKFFSRFSLSDTLNDAETPWAEHYTSLNKPTYQDLGFDERYLQIGNPATSAKKLTNPSRIAGHIFYGQGENISITPSDIGAQPAGEYALKGESYKKEESNQRYQPIGDYLKVGGFGFGGDAAYITQDTGYNGVTQTSVIKGSGVPGTPPEGLAWGAILHLQRDIGRSTQVGFWKGNIGLRSQLDGAWDSEWIFAYTQANTSKDPSGFLRASGSAVALTTNNVMQGAGSSTTNIMSQKAVIDLLVGHGQDWANVTAERKFGVTYRNTSNKQIFVSVTQNSSTNTTSMEVFVNGRLIARPATAGGSTRNSAYFPVMPGQEYVINATGTNSIEVWAEAK